MSAKRDQTIDFFRGVAILLVVLFHFTARLPAHALNIRDGAPLPVFFGWVGVYFFFIISGYCIFMTLERSPTVGVFLARRFSRIYPAFAAAVLLLFAFGLVFSIPSVPEANFHETPTRPIDVVLSLAFLGELGEWVNGSFWSIAVEIKFYVLVAVLAGIIGDRGRFGQVFGWLAIAMGLIWIASTFLSGVGGGSITPQSMLKFLVIAPYLSFFAVGMLGWQFEQGRKVKMLLWANLALSALIVWVETAAGGGRAGPVVAGIGAAVYLALALLFVRFVNGKPIPHIPGVSWAMAQVGLLSFSWYLIHENIGASMLATLNLYLPAQLSLWVVVASTFVIAVAFAQLFEWRFRKPVERVAITVLDWLGRRVRGLGMLRAEAPARPAE